MISPPQDEDAEVSLFTGRYIAEHDNTDFQMWPPWSVPCGQYYYIYFDESGIVQKVALWEIGDEDGYHKKLRENNISES